MEAAGFDPVLLFDSDLESCETLRANRPQWNVQQLDLLEFVGHEHPECLGVDLLAGGPPRVPYSVAGKRRNNERSQDPLRAAVWLATEVRPRAIMLDNVPRLITSDGFRVERDFVRSELANSGYEVAWNVLNAQLYGVPQRRQHGLIVAMAPADLARFVWPAPCDTTVPTVGELLAESMAGDGWEGAAEWRRRASEIAPTIVGGAKDRGGADLGPSRTKKIWERMGVNGGSLADRVPWRGFTVAPEDTKSFPKLTLEQVTMIQGFPGSWLFTGGKTARYRQVGHAMPPPLAAAVGVSIANALSGDDVGRGGLESRGLDTPRRTSSR